MPSSKVTSGGPLLWTWGNLYFKSLSPHTVRGDVLHVAYLNWMRLICNSRHSPIGVRGFNIKNTVKCVISQFLNFGSNFWILYGIPEAPGVSKNLPRARSSIFPKSRPIPSHGDLTHPKYDHFGHVRVLPRTIYFQKTDPYDPPPPISSTIVPPILGTHLDFFARPWYIDIFTILYWIAIPWAS